MLEEGVGRCVVEVLRVLEATPAVRDGAPAVRDGAPPEKRIIIDQVTSIIDLVDAWLKQSDLVGSVDSEKLAVGAIIRPLRNTERDESGKSNIDLVPGEKRWILIRRYMLRWHLLMIGCRS